MGKRPISPRYELVPSDHGDSDPRPCTPRVVRRGVSRYKVVKTACLSAAWLCLGMIHALGSPTLPDLRDRLHTTMEDLSLAFAFRNFGALLGSVLFGMLADRYRKKSDLIMGITIIVSGFPGIIVPHLRSLVILGILSFVSGIGQGGLESVGTAMTQWMWGKQSGASFHAIHLGYPIGSTLAPLIAMHFLGPDREDHNITSVPLCPGNTTCPSVSPLPMYNASMQDSRIEIPYGIVGGVTCLMGCFFILLVFVGTPKQMVYHGTDKNSFLEVFSPKSCRAVGSTAYTCVLLILVCALFVFLNAKDGALSTFVFAFAVESQLRFKKREAALLDTVYRVTEIFGRALSIPAAHFIPIQPMIITCIYVNATFTACLALIGTQKKEYLWVFACLFKFTAAPIWPSAMSWTSTYIRFSSMVVATTQVVLGVTGYGVDWLGGHLYDQDPKLFMYYGMTCGFVLVGLITVMQVVASCCATSPQKSDNPAMEEGTQESLVHGKES